MAKIKVRVLPERKVIELERAMPFLAENGLLFFINWKVMHPLGLALDLTPHPTTGEPCVGRILDSRDRPATAFFGDKFEEGREKWLRYMEREGNAAMERRQKLIGFITQDGRIDEDDPRFR